MHKSQNRYNLAALLILLITVTLMQAQAATTTPDGKEPMLKPLMNRDPQARYEFDGLVGEYIHNLSEHWLKVAVKNNPRLLEDIKNRNQKPYKELEPWAGEFIGKHLTSSAEIYRITRDAEVKKQTDELVDELAAMQAPNGYLGVFADGFQLTGKQPVGKDLVACDAWNHYHIMLGMILWHRETGNAKALTIARKIGDVLCATYLGKPGTLYGAGPREYNYSIVHGLTLLYEDTHEKRYLELAEQVVQKEYRIGYGNDKETTRGMDFVNRALEGQEYFQSKFPAGPRWECMHTLLGVGELAWVTGNAEYARAVEHIWWSMDKTDRHSNGGWGSMEQAFGSPYEVRPMELCCGVAWMALSVDVLRKTADPVVADELELTFLNFAQGFQSRPGVWSSYNVPTDGKTTMAMGGMDNPKRAPNSDICCCTVNGPRGFGLLTEWALQSDEQGLVLNWYGPSKLTAHAKGVAVEIRQQTDYPRTGKVHIEVNPEREGTFALKLRIPHWSHNTQASVNGKPVEGIAAGSYLTLERAWKKGDVIELELEMALHYWVGENESAGRAAFYHGPVLLALPRKKPETYLKYQGKWGMYFTARHLPYVDLYGSNKPGATVSFDFEGTSVAWQYNKFHNCGKAEVKIDGKPEAVVDLYDVTKTEGFESLFAYAWDKPNLFLSARWEKTGLAPGKHKLEITVLPEKNEKSTDHWVTVAQFITELDDPVFDVKTMNAQLKAANPAGMPAVEMDVTDAKGRTFTLRDFDSATENIMPYISWLKVQGAEKTAYSKQNPTRSTYIRNVAENGGK